MAPITQPPHGIRIPVRRLSFIPLTAQSGRCLTFFRDLKSKVEADQEILRRLLDVAGLKEMVTDP